MKTRTQRSYIAVVGFLAAAAAQAFAQQETTAAATNQSTSTTRQFSFLHMSDIHVETFTTMPLDLTNERSYATVKTLKDLGPVEMTPFGITAPKPSFFIATGDNTEYGFAGLTGAVLDRYFEGVTQPVYFAIGNHDNTWAPPTDYFKKRYGGENYSFDFGGCHFIAINSATLQDPNPSFGEETIRFIKNDLRTHDNTTPIFLFCHHPLYGGEFASKYDSDRVVDAVRAHNVVMFFVGHGHSSVKHEFAGIPGVMGGSTFAKGDAATEGYNVVNIDGDTLRVAYRRMRDETAKKPMFDLTIPKRANYPSILTRAEMAEVDGCKMLQISASINGTEAPLKNAIYDLDDETSGELKIEGATASASLFTTGVLNGAHYVRFTFNDKSGKSYQRSTAVNIDNGDKATTATAKWRRQLGGSSRSTPLVADGIVYVGSNDGRLYACEAGNGKLAWTFDAKAEVATAPARYKDLVLFGAADGKFYALTADGKQKWAYDGKLPIFGSPLVHEDTVYFGSNSGVLTALNAATGELRWKNTDAGYSIETRPVLHEGKLYVGAWDGYLYCINAADGKTDWRKPGTANQKRLVRYLSPADASPVLLQNKLYVTDRGYFGGIFDLTGKFEGKIADDVSAFGAAADGRSFYVRNAKSGVSKVDTQTTTVWESDVVAGRIPVPPLEKDGRVYIMTNRGELNVLDAATGQLQYQYRITPRIYTMAAPAIEGDTVYAVGQDGVLTAVSIPPAKH